MEESAFKILKGLFVKKREQIVSVWVTKSKTLEPLSSINSTSKKFNYLRSKYLKLYVELSRQLGKLGALKILYTRLKGSQRDEVGYYNCLFRLGGEAPGALSGRDGLVCGEGFLHEGKKRVVQAIVECYFNKEEKGIRLESVEQVRRTATSWELS